MTCRALTTLDFQQVEELLSEQQTFFGVPTVELPSLVDRPTLQRFFVRYLLEGVNTIARGYFESGELLGFVTGDLVPERKIWVWKLIVIRERLKGTKNSVSHDLCCDAIVETEALGYTRFFSMVPAKYYDVKQPGARWNHIKMLFNYRARVIEQVPAFTKPRDPRHFDLLYGRQVYPVDTLIRFSTKL